MFPLKDYFDTIPILFAYYFIYHHSSEAGRYFPIVCFAVQIPPKVNEFIPRERKDICFAIIGKPTRPHWITPALGN